MLRPHRQILDSKLQPSPLAPSTKLMSLTTLRKRSFRSGSMVMSGYHCRRRWDHRICTCKANVWQPVNPTTGAVASTGWHTHPGHSLIIVTSGSITDYMADCVPHVYTFVPGQPAPTLIDPGHGHVHIIRNEGAIAASTIAVQLVPFDPAKANRRIDAPAPETCS